MRWPNPIHHGNGIAVVYIDERADDSQREALAKIGTGQAGPGGPFEIFSTTYSEPASVVYGPFQVSRDGKSVTLQLGDMASADLEPIISDMDNSEANARMVLPGGFIWQDSEIVNTKNCEVNAQGLSFRHENSSAFLSEVNYNVE